MPHKRIDPSLYMKTKEIIELDDISEEYVTFLESDKKKKKNSFIIWAIAGRDWGKTALTFNEINILLEDNPKRFVQFLKTPLQLIENIKDACPEGLKDRFEVIYKTRDIKKNAILVIDEGLIGLNAKEALKIEMRNLGKFLSKSRHPNIIVLINSVNLNILSEFRDMIDIVIYKHCASTFIKNNRGRDPFLEEYSEIITKLREWEGIVDSYYKWFEKFGMISLQYEDWCPWFNDKISRYQKETSSDVAFDESNRIITNNKKIAKQIINEIGRLYYKKGGFGLFGTWLSDMHPDIYYDNQTQLKKIFNFYKYFLEEDEQNKIDTKEAIEVLTAFEKQTFDTFKFDTFKCSEEDIFTLIRKNKRWRDIERDLTIYQEKGKGKYLQELADKFAIDFTTVSGIAKKVSGAVSYYKGKLFEDFVETRLKQSGLFEKVIKEAGKGDADILAYTKDGKELYIYSIKNLKIDRKPYWLTKEELRSELERAVLQILDHKVHLLLLVFDNFNNKVKQFEIDYNNPKNVDISK